MERETRIELATNSLEGCDSTIELLPQLPSASGPILTSRNNRAVVTLGESRPDSERNWHTVLFPRAQTRFMRADLAPGTFGSTCSTWMRLLLRWVGNLASPNLRTYV
jgi:hypothetical protein